MNVYPYPYTTQHFSRSEGDVSSKPFIQRQPPHAGMHATPVNNPGLLNPYYTYGAGAPVAIPVVFTPVYPAPTSLPSTPGRSSSELPAAQQQQQQSQMLFVPQLYPYAGHANQLQRSASDAGHRRGFRVHPLLGSEAHNLSLNLASPTFEVVIRNANDRSAPFLPRIPFTSVLRSSQSRALLSQNATDPIALEIRIRCRSFGRYQDIWTITIEKSQPITVREVLESIHEAMQTPVTFEERQLFSDKRHRQMFEACSARSLSEETSIPQPLRVDLLEGKHWFGGLERDRDFGKNAFVLITGDAPSS